MLCHVDLALGSFRSSVFFQYMADCLLLIHNHFENFLDLPELFLVSAVVFEE